MRFIGLCSATCKAYSKKGLIEAGGMTTRLVYRAVGKKTKLATNLRHGLRQTRDHLATPG
jgi:hypothetical protein